jgi:flagella basal body P-ring formation protein FlgA
VLGKETAVYIRMNQPIFPYMIREVPLVRTKQKIKLRWADPLVLVQVEGMALEDGYLNEEISVMNLASSKKLKGIVLSSGVVEIR